jgi:hypothetical protein
VVPERSLGSSLLDRRRAGGGCPRRAPRGGRSGRCGWSHGRVDWRLHLRMVTRHDGGALVFMDDSNSGAWHSRQRSAWWCAERSAGESKAGAIV